MSEADLSRLRRDLDVIQCAAGLQLPFGWWEVKQTLALVPCGAIIATWASFGPWDNIFVSLLPCFVLAVVAVGRSLVQFRRQIGQRREHKVDLILCAVFVVAMAGLMAWERMIGLPGKAMRAAAVFMAGVMCLSLAFTSPTRRVCAAGAVAMIPFALIVPLCTHPQVVLAGGFAMMVAGLVAGGIMAVQLRAERREHEPTTD